MTGGFAETLVALASKRQAQRQAAAEALQKKKKKNKRNQQQQQQPNDDEPRRPARRLSSVLVEQSLSHVYVRDRDYAWLPAKVLQNHPDTKQVTVQITLPSHWHKSTVIRPNSTIEEMEQFLLESNPSGNNSTSNKKNTHDKANDNRHDDDEDNDMASTASSKQSSSAAPSMALRTVSLLDYPSHELPLQNSAQLETKVYGHALGKRDMADLPFLHEPAILYNLKDRHYHQQPYTRVGDIVVAMNPFSWMHHLYSDETRDLYAKSIVWEAQLEQEEEKQKHQEEERQLLLLQQQQSSSNVLAASPSARQQRQQQEESAVHTFGSLYDKLGFDPHVYEVSCLAYRGLATEHRKQTILVSGESGAGKTETVKIVISHLAALEQSRPGGAVPVVRENRIGGVETVRRVLESSPVFEAFGNAKTLHNDNSSRFGKFTQLQFDLESLENAKRAERAVPACSLAGSLCVTYLLEKSRVVSHAMGERGYHIFYQLMAAPEEFKQSVWSGLANKDVEDFQYLGHTDIRSIAGVSDVEQWPRTLEALKVFELVGSSLNTLMRALCVVLQLGNLTFDQDPGSDHEEGGTVITSVEELQKLSKLIGIDAQLIESAMTLRLIKTGYDEVHVNLRPSVAKDSCDALAKEIYARIFDVLVRKINDYTRAEGHYLPEHNEFGMISLLDIFGFERGEVNRFEQLCINYANEQLQYKYVLDNFEKVKQEYEAEGIEIFDFSVVDNSDVLNLLEGRLGLIVSLNEECIRPKGNDESFVYKIKVAHKDHSRLIDKKLHRKTEFGVRHFAGSVTYDSTKFVERNTDKLPDGLLYCAAQSTNELIRKEFEALVAASDEGESPGIRRKKSTSRTVLQKFRAQLKDLMASMENSTTRYIRCIKPNETMTPKLTQHDMTMRQLECAGLVTAIAISRESFPNKLDYDTAKERFECLMFGKHVKKMAGMETKDAVHYMVSNLLWSMAEEQRSGDFAMPFQCGKTKIYFRAGALEFLEMKRLDYYTNHVVVIQRWVRKLQARARYIKTRGDIITAQMVARGHIERHRYRRRKAAIVVLQCWTRGCQASSSLTKLRLNHAATVIQRSWRATSSRSRMLQYKWAAIVIQRAARNKRSKTTLWLKLARAAKEAKMDHQLLGLQRQVSQVSMGYRSTAARTVDEKLLSEVETMFDYLRKEIMMLRKENTELKEDLEEAESDKREILMHAESSEAAAKSSRLQVAQLSKANSALSKEILEHRHEAAMLRKELKIASTCREEEVSAVRIDYDHLLEDRAREIASLQLTVRNCHKKCEQEKQLLKAEMTKMEEGHVAEIVRLKDELRRTQNSHHDYLAKLMDVLETTHAAREAETARISEELNAVKEEKDTQIIQLQQEVARLKSLKKSETPGPSAAGSQSQMLEMDGIRRDVTHNAALRQQRSQKFTQAMQQLENTVLPSGRPASNRRIGRRTSSRNLSEDDIANARDMFQYIGDLWATGEASQTQVDQNTMNTLERWTVSTFGASETVEEMQGRLAALESENEQLQEQIAELARCPRCEARDRRRARQAAAERAQHPDYSGANR